MNQTEFVNEYIEKLQEEVNSLMKEKIIFRAQISVLDKKIQELEGALLATKTELDKVKSKKSKSTANTEVNNETF